MKTIARFLILATISFWAYSAGAQNPSYSSKAEWTRKPVQTHLPTVVSNFSKSNFSTKPWLWEQAGAEEHVPAATLASAELRNLNFNDYNTKKAARGEGPVEF